MADQLIPQHIGIIMDGNGRWAKLRGLPRYAGHSVGAKTFRRIAEYCNRIGVRYLTVYAFSTENWKRPQKEVDTILELMMDYLRDAESYVKLNIKTHFIGDLSAFSEEMRQMMDHAEKLSENATGLTVNIAINYGGRRELAQAMQKIAAEVKSGTLLPEQIDESTVAAHLYTAGQPDVDLLIRPSGEYRLSNFMLWQTAYAEYVFMDTLWPDFSEKMLDNAIREFQKRNRRFGGAE